MTKLIWLHDKALTENISSLHNLGADTEVIYIWDDGYYKKRNYSTKRLVFIYETLCELPYDIIHGDTVDVLLNYNPQVIYIPKTTDSVINELCNKINERFEIELLKPEIFCELNHNMQFTRFFKYWNFAKKTAFNENGKLEPKTSI